MSNIVSNDNILVLNYDERDYPFRSVLESVLGTTDLEHLHETVEVDVDNYVEVCNELICRVSAVIMEFNSIIRSFYQDLLEPIFGSALHVQNEPTMRVYLSVDDPRLDRERALYRQLSQEDFLQALYFNGGHNRTFHRDGDYKLPRSAINLWLPLTNVSDTNSLWVGGPDRGGVDAKPVNLKRGECMLFDGAGRWHGSVWNTTGLTRVSFDWRFIPAEQRKVGMSLRLAN